MDYLINDVGTTGWSCGDKNKVEPIHNSLPQNKLQIGKKIKNTKRQREMNKKTIRVLVG